MARTSSSQRRGGSVCWALVCCDDVNSSRVLSKNEGEQALTTYIQHPSLAQNILGQAAFQFVVNFFCLYRPDVIFGPAPDGSSLLEKHNDTLHLTLFFNTFVMCQLFNEINSRKIHGGVLWAPRPSLCARMRLFSSDFVLARGRFPADFARG